ncbi:hypothetical protein Taro_035765 [Colocasia esculenta]|uniref:Protein kinase domain-containing protein n=1 Tax=Colocasia esculenta TaxID=4460 RepID=A0A843WJL1_COLES|nr:hypothetical protein [Colocasia esculenta]
MAKFCCFRPSASRNKLEGSGKGESGVYSTGTPENVRLFSYNSLRKATRNFTPTNRVGRGGFGVVYKGILRDGTPVAIKSLSAESKQGISEFLTEIDMVSSVRHPNLVKLIGCCIEGNNRMLVYEYLENNSLANALLGPRKLQTFMDWPKRATVCIGTAQGLAFLHEEARPHIVHRDIKASNVLLDKDLTPKIGDFGLAKLFPDSVSHISTRVAGTMGYLAPEYALLGQLTKKADVYSFGVLVLEIVSGSSSSKSAWGTDLNVLLEWVWILLDKGRLLDIVDPEMQKYPDKDVLRFIKVALLCTQAAAQQRPSMKKVVDLLSQDVDIDVGNLIRPGIIKELNCTSKPPKFRQYRGNSTLRVDTPSTGDSHCSPLSTVELQPR